MNLGLAYRTAIRKLSASLEAEFDRLFGTLQKWSANVETTTLTAESITVGGFAQPPNQWALLTADLITSGSTVTTVPDLSVDLEGPGETYLFDALLHCPTPNVLKLALGGTATNSSTAGDPNISYLIEVIDTTTDIFALAHGSHNSYGLGVTHTTPGGGNQTVRWSGWLKTEIAGTLTIQIASGGGSITLRRGSWLRVTRM